MRVAAIGEIATGYLVSSAALHGSLPREHLERRGQVGAAPGAALSRRGRTRTDSLERLRAGPSLSLPVRRNAHGEGTREAAAQGSRRLRTLSDPKGSAPRRVATSSRVRCAVGVEVVPDAADALVRRVRDPHRAVAVEDHG